MRAGHSSESVTLDIYSHVTDAMQKDAAERIDDILTGGGNASQTSGANPAPIGGFGVARVVLSH